jgi:hypothetical protein
MGTGSRSLRSVPVPISPILTRGVGKGGQAQAEYVLSQSPFPYRRKQPYPTFKEPRRARANSAESSGCSEPTEGGPSVE